MMSHCPHQQHFSFCPERKLSRPSLAAAGSVLRAAARASAGGGAIVVAEVCAFSVVPRFEVAVLNQKLVAAESAAIASNHNHVCY
jgi:hypothetical protein